MGVIHTYNPKEVTISLGNHIVTGYAEDSFITIEPHGDGVTMKSGCDGEIARSLNPDTTFSIKLTTLWQSATTSFLQERYDYDLATGDGMFPVLVKDMKGTLVFSAAQAWVVKPAAREYARESGNREWEIQTGEATLNE